MPSATRTPPLICRAGPADAAVLAALAASTFADTFAADNDPRDMELYARQAFGDAVQRAELLDPRNTVLFAERGDDVVGYAMLHDGDVPACVAPQVAAVEIARLYATATSIGSGVGAALMQACLDEAAARGHATIWLGVWERNARAIAFYERWGFHMVGTQPFQLGRDRQTDRVMQRPVRVEP